MQLRTAPCDSYNSCTTQELLSPSGQVAWQGYLLPHAHCPAPHLELPGDTKKGMRSILDLCLFLEEEVFFVCYLRGSSLILYSTLRSFSSFMKRGPAGADGHWSKVEGAYWKHRKPQPVFNHCSGNSSGSDSFPRFVTSLYWKVFSEFWYCDWKCHFCQLDWPARLGSCLAWCKCDHWSCQTPRVLLRGDWQHPLVHEPVDGGKTRANLIVFAFSANNFG